MASISCCIQLSVNSRTSSSNLHSTSTNSVLKLRNGFLGIPRKVTVSGANTKLGPTNGGRVKCWFKFNSESAEKAGIYGSQSRDDFDKDDVEQYFNYMGMLAVEGSYDKMEALLNQNIHPVDILLLMACSEGDKPKVEELLKAGANYDVKDADGRTALDRADDDMRDFIINFKAQKA